MPDGSEYKDTSKPARRRNQQADVDHEVRNQFEGLPAVGDFLARGYESGQFTREEVERMGKEFGTNPAAAAVFVTNMSVNKASIQAIPNTAPVTVADTTDAPAAPGMKSKKLNPPQDNLN